MSRTFDRVARWLSGPRPPRPFSVDVAIRGTATTPITVKTEGDTNWITVGDDYGTRLTLWASAYDFGPLDLHDCDGTVEFLRKFREALDEAETAVCKAHSRHKAGIR